MDIRSEVYNALADIMFQTNATEQDMQDAIKWFEARFFEYEE